MTIDAVNGKESGKSSISKQDDKCDLRYKFDMTATVTWNVRAKLGGGRREGADVLFFPVFQHMCAREHLLDS